MRIAEIVQFIGPIGIISQSSPGRRVSACAGALTRYPGSQTWCLPGWVICLSPDPPKDIWRSSLGH